MAIRKGKSHFKTYRKSSLHRNVNSIATCFSQISKLIAPKLKNKIYSRRNKTTIEQVDKSTYPSETNTITISRTYVKYFFKSKLFKCCFYAQLLSV